MLSPANKKGEPLVSLENVGVLRGGRWLVRGVEFSVSRGEIVTLIGAERLWQIDERQGSDRRVEA